MEEKLYVENIHEKIGEKIWKEMINDSV